MQNLKKILKNKKGFTLVELMVVVAILGILVAVAVPVYSSVTENAEKNTCAANIRTIESAIVVYEAEKGSITGTTGDGSITAQELKNALVPNYLAEMPQCPSDSTKTDANGDYSVDATGKVKCDKTTSHNS